ncbi:hypothetical protein [Spirosoma profusum]|nr:hypothetical protein [Spirosoma profusum]
MNTTFISISLLSIGLLITTEAAMAQTRPTQRRRFLGLGRSREEVMQRREKREKPEQPCIYFPQAPQPGEWRRSVGLVFTATPPEITEEVRVSVPAIDLNLQRGLTKNLYVVGRLQTQFIQNSLNLGLRYAMPLSEKWFVSAGYDINGWMGVLKIRDVFDAQAYGVSNYPNVSVGYRLTRTLQLMARTEAIFDFYYHSQVGSLSVDYHRPQLSGVAFAFALEQPFYKKQHVTLGIRAAYSRFNWQFWSLYETFDRPLFYPQLFFGFIL